MRYVERDATGKIIGDYANPQEGRAEEELPDDHPELAARNKAAQREADAERAALRK